ncbi:glycosyltransferase family 31 protein [Polychaeton citri CBS 116435]|uniref:Glycosyltransferase family 31 protein n=1 Tax=Polychaeton citri CBS 116435 TaxID=1314669 RepID=A0A9P4UTL6_9PEZI|nr:glycosyltransferase family 31 protein [Polychaeton citri CBS 116435]
MAVSPHDQSYGWPSKGRSCPTEEQQSDVAVIFKTGSTEIYDRLMVHFTTTLACIKDYLIFSDFEQTIGPERVHDALVNISWGRLGDSNEDAKQYMLLQQHLDHGGAASELRASDRIHSWDLDKYKFLPLVSAARERFPEKKWFVFVEADTYLSLHNLLLWLPKLKEEHRDEGDDGADVPIYAGSCIFIGDLVFAHGGSGWLMSASAAQAMSEVYAMEKTHWEDVLSRDCCGDKVLGQILQDRSIECTQAFPSFQGETPVSLDWNADIMCKPAITWHHAAADQVEQLWQFEQRWRKEKGGDTMILYRDYFMEFIRPRLDYAENSKLLDWDNLSSDWVFTSDDDEDNLKYESSEAVESPERCEDFCVEHDDCLQWVWQPKWCRANRAVRFGWAMVDGDARPVSGWMVDRIDSLLENAGPCDDE